MEWPSPSHQASGSYLLQSSPAAVWEPSPSTRDILEPSPPISGRNCMTTPSTNRQPRPIKRWIIFTLMFVSLTGLGGLLATQGTTSLLVACLDDEAAGLTANVSCAYLQFVRNPDPNQPDRGEPLVAGPKRVLPLTVFGFTLAGHRVDNPRSGALIDHFIRRGVTWDTSHDNGMTPLHLAVLFGHEDLITRFIEAGASPTTRAKAAGTSCDGKTVLEWLAILRRGSPSRPQTPEAMARLDRIQKLLTRP